ncbi:WhiB family transcriptional regulator [Streptomyces sp. NBC_01451]|uniref:WhiB family transcriptional regulator n=1 Tax=Streptomyces sp. NBC_01451 TaxID=2903872 RepID=UPI003FCC9B30
MEWLRRAARTGEDPELFFPVGTQGPAVRDIAVARRVRAHCPVTPRCPDRALRSGRSGHRGAASAKRNAPHCSVPRENGSGSENPGRETRRSNP